MKKVLIAMCAMAAVMACTKTEATFEHPGEISFSPVSKYNTKAAVTSTNFTANQNFYVFANTVDENEKYFANILFEADGTNKSTNNYQVYKGNPAQFWPNVKNLKFAGYTVTGNVGADLSSIQASMSDDFSTMTLTSYQQPLPTVAGANDLMWFFDANGGTGYGKNTSYVEPAMAHACSWITINIKAESEALCNYWKNLKVQAVSFENLITTNTATMKSGTVSWGAATLPSPAVPVAILTDKTGGDENAKTLSHTASVECADIVNNTIVIPQAPVTIAVTYSYTSPADAAVTITETKTSISLDYDNDADTNTAWVAGTHYTYELTIGANEIKIAPKSTDWTTPTSGDFTQDVK